MAEVNTSSPQPPTPPGKAAGSTPTGSDQHKVMAIIGYILPILFFIPLVTDAKNNQFARFHANQQLNLLLFAVIGNIVASVTVVIAIGVLLYPVVQIASLVFMIMGIINAAKMEMKPLPLIGKFNLIK